MLLCFRAPTSPISLDDRKIFPVAAISLRSASTLELSARSHVTVTKITHTDVYSQNVCVIEVLYISTLCDVCIQTEC